MKPTPFPGRPATFSFCFKYRFSLWRSWLGGDGVLMVIGLNPSTADDIYDDPTIRRCIGFAQVLGYHELCMTNLFAFRATYPSEMKRQNDPVGYGNNGELRYCAAGAKLIVAAWGTKGTHLGRDKTVRAMLPPMHCFRLTPKSGQPEHPLYLPSDLIPIPLCQP
jgi:hypothetical protein